MSRNSITYMNSGNVEVLKPTFRRILADLVFAEIRRVNELANQQPTERLRRAMDEYSNRLTELHKGLYDESWDE